MRIGMDATPLVNGHPSAGPYLEGLLAGLDALGGDNACYLYSNSGFELPAGLSSRFVPKIPERAGRMQIWLQITLPGRMSSDQIDLFHAPWPRLPALVPVPSVVTIHDLAEYTMPSSHGLQAWFNNLWLPNLLERAGRVVALSEFTASDLRRFFPQAAAKVCTVPPAPDPSFAPRPGGAPGPGGLPARYALFAGDLHPWRNTDRLLDAWDSCGDRGDAVLVIAGRPSRRSRAVTERIAASVRRGTAVHLAPEPGELAALHAGALFLAFPSLYEGNGLPVLNAMSCGLPVLTSRDSAMSEAADDAALLVDPHSVESISGGLSALLADARLAGDLAGRGLERARMFSREETARLTARVYSEVLEA